MIETSTNEYISENNIVLMNDTTVKFNLLFAGDYNEQKRNFDRSQLFDSTRHSSQLTCLISRLDQLSDNSEFNEYDWRRTYWPNTVHLSVFIKDLIDLRVLLDTDVLPVLNHLCVTFIRKDKCHRENAEQAENFPTITSRLRSLKLSHMSMENLLTFLSSTQMSLLEELTLIEIHDHSKTNKGILARSFEVMCT